MVKTSEDNIIDQLLLDLQKMSTQNTRQSSQAEVSVDHQELASIEYNINPSKHSQNNEPDAEPADPPPPGHPPPRQKKYLSYQLPDRPLKNVQICRS